MKNLFILSMLAFLISCQDCSEHSDKTNEKPISICHEVESNTDIRTLIATNCVDAKGLRQGHWCVMGKDDPAKGFPPEGKIEEGEYKDGTKHRTWYYYNINGKDVDSTVKYDMGVVIEIEKTDSVQIE